MEAVTRRSWTAWLLLRMLGGEEEDHDELLEEALLAAAGPWGLGDPARARRNAL